IADRESRRGSPSPVDCGAAARASARHRLDGRVVQRGYEVRRHRYARPLARRLLVHSGRERHRARARSETPTAGETENPQEGVMLKISAPPRRRLPWPPSDLGDPDALVLQEWLVTNGLGGYASGTVAGVITRRYHGLLIAALAAPLGRTVMLSHVAEQVRFRDGRRIEFGGRERTIEAADAHGAGCPTPVRLESGLAVRHYARG